MHNDYHYVQYIISPCPNLEIRALIRIYPRNEPYKTRRSFHVKQTVQEVR